MVQKSSGVPDKRRGRPRAFDPAQVLDQVLLVFWREGYEGADYAKLTGATGLSKPSLYAAFGDKESLFAAAIQRYAAAIASRPVAAARGASSLKAALNAFFRTLAENVGGAWGPRGCLIANVATDAAETRPRLRTALAEGMRQSRADLAGLLRDSVDRGDVAPDFPVEERADLWVDLTHAMVIRGRLGAGADELATMVERATGAVLAPHARVVPE